MEQQSEIQSNVSDSMNTQETKVAVLEAYVLA